MKICHSKIFIIFAAVIFVLAALAAVAVVQSKKKNSIHKNSNIINIGTMQIKSPAFINDQYLPIKYTCDGEGVNPPLEFLDVPKDAQSLALVIFDPDAPSGTWYHWVIWNIPPETKSIAENSVPAGAVVGKGSDGQNKYGPACPPFGIHHYIFTLYALGVNLDLKPQDSFKEFEQEAEKYLLDKAELTGLYGKF